MPELSTWVSCGDVFLSTNYGIELKGGQVFVNIENDNDSFALRMQPDGGSLIGSGTVPLRGYVPGGVVVRRQRRQLPARSRALK